VTVDNSALFSLLEQEPCCGISKSGSNPSTSLRPSWQDPYGKGRHPAALNFAYALSRSTGEPLLYIGQDFLKTDVKAALLV
jgi:hypothetical protein